MIIIHKWYLNENSNEIKISTQRYLLGLLLFIMGLLKCKNYHDNPLLKILFNSSPHPIPQIKTCPYNILAEITTTVPLLLYSDLTNPQLTPNYSASALVVKFAHTVSLFRTFVVLSLSFLSLNVSLSLPQFPQAWAIRWLLNMGNGCLCPVTVL